jgi:hypothetical protein
VSGFKQAGLFPFTYEGVNVSKLAPSRAYVEDIPAIANTSVVEPSEQDVVPSTSSTPDFPSMPSQLVDINGDTYEMVLKPVKMRQPTIDEILSIPTVPKKKRKPTIDLTKGPLILTSDEVNNQLKEKEEKNRIEDEAKENRKITREAKKVAKQETDRKKKEGKKDEGKKDEGKKDEGKKDEGKKDGKKDEGKKDEGKKDKGKTEDDKTQRKSKRKTKKRTYSSSESEEDEDDTQLASWDSSDDDDIVDYDEGVPPLERSCAECWTEFRKSSETIGCDNCERWYHRGCTTLSCDGLSDKAISQLQFICGNC